MKTTVKEAPRVTPLQKQRSYQEIIDYLNANWGIHKDEESLARMRALDKALGTPSKTIQSILVTGTNGKSLTINFAAQLLTREKLRVGTFCAPHVMLYNERISVNNEYISNKQFIDYGNQVLDVVEGMELKPGSYEILHAMALLYFKESKIDVALMEAHRGGTSDAVTLCKPLIVAIPRIITDDQSNNIAEIERLLDVLKPNMYVASADQSKLNLQIMQQFATKRETTWSMPVRKLAQLCYPFEQLHGRCAALAERIAYIYVNECMPKGALPGASLLTRQRGQRGRPTLEAKRQSDLNPKKTVDQFWKETSITLAHRFQMLDKEKPSVLLDNASNLDAFENLLLGIRLLHYQRPLKGLALVIGCNNPSLNVPEFLKLVRYFFKKTSGQIVVCPAESLPGDSHATSWDVEKITNDIKSVKVKARAAKTFKEAFSAAQKMVDERNGLVVITGSNAVINSYWNYKGMKKI